MKKILFIVLSVSILINRINAQTAPEPHGCKQKVDHDILIVGDSWAYFMITYHGYRDALRELGFADYVNFKTPTSVIGAQAGTFTNGMGKTNLRRALLLHPELKTVVLILGGNDFIWDCDLDQGYECLDHSIAETNKGMDTVVNVIRAIRSDIRIVLPSYDYPNFVDALIEWPENPYYDTWEGFGSPTPIEANTILKYVEGKREEWSHTQSNMLYVQNLGLMQYIYGQPDTLPDTNPLGYDYPRLPPYPPKSVPFPFGDLRYPTPQKAMGLAKLDTYHLGPGGFKEYAKNQIKVAFLDELRGHPDATFISEGKQLDGSISSAGEINNKSLQLGTRKNNGTHYKSIIHINTEDIPDDAVITGASVFITRSTVEGKNPLKGIFPSNARIDIKSGSFNNPGIEVGDYTALPDMDDVGCFVGNGNYNYDATRIDIKPEALGFINKTGATEFRFDYITSFNVQNQVMNYFTGDPQAENEWRPYMDVHYTINQPGRKAFVNTNSFEIYPNPAYSMINIRSNTEISTLDITDVLGRNLHIQGQMDAINISDLSPGLIMVRVNWKDGTSEIKKIIKQ